MSCLLWRVDALADQSRNQSGFHKLMYCDTLAQAKVLIITSKLEPNGHKRAMKIWQYINKVCFKWHLFEGNCVWFVNDRGQSMTCYRRLNEIENICSSVWKFDSIFYFFKWHLCEGNYVWFVNHRGQWHFTSVWIFFCLIKQKKKYDGIGLVVSWDFKKYPLAVLTGWPVNEL